MSVLPEVQPEIACRQVLRKESSVHSEQWTVLPAAYAGGLTPERLLELYLRHIRRFTGSLIRPQQGAEGIEFRLGGQCLLRFGEPRQEPGRLTLAICGGLLVEPQSCHRGELSFGCEPLPEGLRVTLRLADYCPLLLGSGSPSRWRKWFYRLTQAAIHRLVTVRFLVRLHRDLAGRRICCRVVRVRGAGENL